MWIIFSFITALLETSKDVLGLAELTRGFSLQTGYTPYVVAITRTSILTSSLAGKLFFGDRFSKINLLGIFLMFSGILFLVFFP